MNIVVKSYHEIFESREKPKYSHFFVVERLALRKEFSNAK